MTEAHRPMSRIERVAAFVLLSVLAAAFLHREQRVLRGPAAPMELAARLGCGRVETCVAREAHLIQHLSGCVRTADRGCIQSAEQELVDVRKALARFAPEDDVHFDGELDSHAGRAHAMEELMNAYAGLSAEERAAIAPSPPSP